MFCEKALSKTLAIGRADFFRLFPSVLPDVKLRIEGQGLSAAQGESILEIRLTEKKKLKIGAVSLPQLQIDMIFRGWESSEIDRFIARFERCFQRGGG
ncbi:MAG: hypothetical protein ACU826_01725 [Gammaproteobacteria bacterium]